MIADKFNDYFENIGPTLAKKIPNEQLQPLSYLRGNYHDSLYAYPVSDQ